MRVAWTACLLALAFFMTSMASAESEVLFTFAIIADPHVSGKAEHAKRLDAGVRWINEHREKRKIELLLVLGDIAWGAKSRIEKAKTILDRSVPPYVPIIGDNEIESGSEVRFHEVFAKQYARLGKRLVNWRKAPTPVVDPATKRRLHLQNFSFDHRGVHFIGLDWCTRAGGESADLHDFPGGTLRWLRDDVKKAAKGTKNRVVLLSHLPMHCNVVYEVFRAEEQAAVDRILRPHAKYVYADFAGHYHFEWSSVRPEGGYSLFVTDAAFRGHNTIRLVTVRRSRDRFTYIHEMIRVPAKVRAGK
jgi:Calcineurin-like phosphoesterase